MFLELTVQPPPLHPYPTLTQYPWGRVPDLLLLRFKRHLFKTILAKSAQKSSKCYFFKEVHWYFEITQQFDIVRHVLLYHKLFVHSLFLSLTVVMHWTGRLIDSSLSLPGETEKRNFLFVVDFATATTIRTLRVLNGDRRFCDLLFQIKLIKRRNRIFNWCNPRI